EPSARVFSTRAMDVSGWQIAGLSLQPEERTNDWIRWRAHAFGGEHGTPPATYEEVAFTRGSETLRALGVVFVSSPPDAPQDSSAFTTEARTSGEIVQRLRTGLGRAYAVGRVTAVTSERAVGGAMLGDRFRADSVAYTVDADAAGDYPGSASVRVRWL